MKKVICWWSGGVTSAVACKKAIQLYGHKNCRIVFIDTYNEDEDTYRFMYECSRWYGMGMEVISNDNYETIEEVWVKHESLNVANGAICSSELKRAVRLEFQKHNSFSHQVFGFDIDEPKRARAMAMNYPDCNPIFPLLMYGLSKKDCIGQIEDAGIEIPRMYKLGFRNNNCFKTGCVQGGIGYWQKMRTDFPDKFYKMAEMEHKLTNLKGKPVTMLKDQAKGGGLLFLMPHPDYPDVKDVSMKKGRAVKPLFECNGFCGINDLSPRSETEKEINLSE